MLFDWPHLPQIPVHDLTGLPPGAAIPELARREPAMLDAILSAAERGEYPEYAAAEQAAMDVTLLLASSGRPLDADPRIEALFTDLKDDER